MIDLPARKGAARTSYLEGWRLYPLSMVGHHAQGAGIAYAAWQGTAPLIAMAGLWTTLYIAYQALSVLRKNDSPGLDIVDLMAGFAACVAVLAVLEAT